MKKVRRREISSAESCGFVTYFLCFPVAWMYIVWATSESDSGIGSAIGIGIGSLLFQKDNDGGKGILHQMNITYYPHASLAIILPTCIVMLFLSIPMMYSILNEKYAVPHYEDGNTLYDGHSRTRTRISIQVATASTSTSTSTSTDAIEDEDGEGSDRNTNTRAQAVAIPTIPETFDIDVAIINQSINQSLAASHMKHNS
uniref:PIG-P domain-containing protein n=1 Tax=Chaetoceros debilis TaxID=122233 RepID=A0A7S3Q4J9_9STRA